MSSRFGRTPDVNGYFTTTCGRWKAADHRARPGGRIDGVTLTDITRQARFAETDASWIRRPSWDAVRETIRAFE